MRKVIFAVVVWALALVPAALAQSGSAPNYQAIPNYTGTGAGQQFRNDLNNHLSGVTPISPRIVKIYLSKDSRCEVKLGFAKVAGDWGLSVREARYDYDKQGDEWIAVGETSATKLRDASRDMRIKALELLPALISTLKSKAESDTRAILDAKKLLGW